MPFVLFGALAIGLCLGLLGSGGSILTVPVLVYLLGHEDKVAIAESLAIVGGIALLAAAQYARRGLVDWRTVLFFGLPGMAGTYAGAWLARYVPGPIQLTAFGGVMLLAAGVMLRRPAPRAPEEAGGNSAGGTGRGAGPRTLAGIAAEGAGVGAVTGLVGVGGGFLIVPALVLLLRLPMRTAVGTSLAVIVLNAASGFYKYSDVLGSFDRAVDWPTIGVFIAVGAAGSLTGNLIASRLDQQALRRAFGVFLILMGLFVLGKEIPHAVGPGRGAHAAPARAAHPGGQLAARSEHESSHP